MQTLRQYAKLKKLPGVIKLGNIDTETQQQLLNLFMHTPVSNKTASDNRKGIYGVEHNDTTPLGKTYNQRHLSNTVTEIGCLKEYINIHEWRFADMQPKSSIPTHLDDPYSYRFIVMLQGKHEFTYNEDCVTMQEKEVWFVNSAYHHSVYNNTDNIRIALLGKIDVNDHNTGLLRTRT